MRQSAGCPKERLCEPLELNEVTSSLGLTEEEVAGHGDAFCRELLHVMGPERAN